MTFSYAMGLGISGVSTDLRGVLTTYSEGV